MHDLTLYFVPILLWDAAQVTAAQFFAQWNTVGAANETQVQFKLKDGVDVQQTVGSLRIGVLPGVDPNPTNIVGAATFNCDTPTVVLLRLERAPDKCTCRLTVRCSEAAAADSVSVTLEQKIGDGGGRAMIHLEV